LPQTQLGELTALYQTHLLYLRGSTSKGKKGGKEGKGERRKGEREGWMLRVGRGKVEMEERGGVGKEMSLTITKGKGRERKGLGGREKGHKRRGRDLPDQYQTASCAPV